MSRFAAFKRQPVPAQAAPQDQVVVFPAPTRGLILSENEAFMKPGGALVLDNWAPTLRGLKLRGGCIRWAELPETTPVISGFRYVSGNTHKMYAANLTKLYEVTTPTPAVIASGRTSGNYATAQLANAADDYLIAVNDAGDPALRFDGTTWASLATSSIPNWTTSTLYAINDKRKDPDDGTRWKCLVGHTSPATGTFAAARAASPSQWTLDVAADGISFITGPPGSNVEGGGNLSYVCKYRNRLFFVEKDSMNAWYLGINSVGGALSMIPLSGAATQGGKLLFCATWSLDAGDGIDDKLVFCTDQGELLIFTGSNPSDANNWRQEGRYQVPKPMGMNAHITLGGDLLIATMEGIVPTSEAITKEGEQLELAMLTVNIKSMWRDEAIAKKEWPWTMFRWEEFGGMFVTWPGGEAGAKLCAAVNTVTNAWCRFVGYDATCFMQLRGDMFFGTQDGIIMQADRTGYDDGVPYVATMVGGWETFGSSAYTVVWDQARASFNSGNNEPFEPQLGACVDYVVQTPPAPSAGPDPGVSDLWDQGLWDNMKWDQPAPATRGVIRNTGWVSIGMTGFAHAPVLQVTVAQSAKPRVEYIAMAASVKRVGAVV